MAVLPVLLVAVGSLLLWFTSRQYRRDWWALGSGWALLTWLTTLALSTQIPTATSLSVWRPMELFASRLELRLDVVGWALAYSGVTVLVAVALTGAARRPIPGSQMRTLMFGYSALGLLAILGGNLLTIVSAWALMDLATYFLNYGLLGKPRDPGRPTIRLAANGAGLLLVIAAALVSWQSGVEGDFSGGGMSTLSSWLLVAACTFRLGLMPLHFTLPKVPGLRRGIGTLLRLLPPAAALALLARQFGHSLPPEMVPWLLAIGAVGALIGGLRWGLGGVSVEARPFLVLGVSGLGVLAAGLDAENASAAIQSAAVTLLMVGAVVSLAGIHTPWHRAAPWAAAMLLVGFPGTPSSFLVESLGKGLGDARLMWATATGILTLVVLVAGTFRRGLASLTPWEANEDFARLAYGLGIFLPVMAGIGLGFSSRPRITLEGSLVLILVLALSTLSLYALRRVPVESLGRWGRLTIWFDLGPIYRLVGQVYTAFLRSIRWVSQVVEGKAAFLWLIVIVLLLGVGLAG